MLRIRGRRKNDQAARGTRGQGEGVSTATDTFASFVDSLATSLDDHAVRGEDLAARVFMSRFHFDRVVSAVAGETPSRLRRRILLERSAYRLVSSDDGVLAIALEAGYSSNEAFTRAFRRAYGVGPSTWRASPGQIQLEAPSGVHFHPPGGLRLPARDEVTSMDLTTKLVEHRVWVVGEIVERAARLSGEQLDAPIELSVEGVDDDPTLRSLLSRLVGQMDMWNAAMANRPYDFGVERDESLASVRSRLDVAGPAFLEQARAVIAESRLDETVVDATCDPPEVFTYGGMLAHVLTFAAHRRTLAIGALYSAGIRDLDAGDPMRWVAEAA
jgi:AraC family transcriptional regulator